MDEQLPFGRRVRQLRTKRDLTQEHLAERVACSVETIRKIESGERRPSHQIAERLARALDLAPADQPAFLRLARLPSEGKGSQPPAADPERQHSLTHTDPPVHTDPAAQLPLPLTLFVGRELELVALAQRLDDPASRLVTLLGTGGAGKTRLALQAAAAFQARCGQAVCFVALAPLASADLLVPSIAQALNFTFSGAADPAAQLLRHLSDKELLLLLDNFEHLLDGVALLSAILAQAPGVKLLVTSRERLLLQWEWVVEIQGLSLGDGVHDQAPSSAYALFLDRARRVQAGFQPSAHEAEHIRQICRLVEGMPLGIELAAAWVRILSCAEIAQEIERNLDFLAASARDLPERHRSLRAVFMQSWGLLSDTERKTLRRLSVFRSSFSREAAITTVSGGLPSIASDGQLPVQHTELLTSLAALVDKSLLRRSDSGRFDMHELIRQYAEQQLRLENEEQSTRERHARYYLALAEQAAPQLRGPGQARWHDRLELEHDNLRTALAWALEPGAQHAAPDGLPQPHSSRPSEIGLQLVGALWGFWELHSHFSEGRRWIERALELRSEVSPAVRAKALCGIGVMTEANGATALSIALLEESLAIRRELGDTAGIAESLLYLGRQARNQGDGQRAAMLEAESLALFRSIHAAWGMIWALLSLGDAALDRGDTASAAQYLHEAYALAQTQNDKHSSAWALCNLGRIAHLQNDDAQAIVCYHEGLDLFDEISSVWGRAEIMCELARALHAQGDDRRAAGYFQQSLSLLRDLNGTRLISLCLEGLAGLAGAGGKPAQAARLFGAAAALRASCGPPLPAAYRAYEAHEQARAQAALDQAAWAAAYEQGQALALDTAISEALRVAERFQHAA